MPASQACRAKEAELDEHMCRLRLPKVLARSSFVALSGQDDVFSSIQELANRRGVFLDPKMVPIFELYDDSEHLSAYCLGSSKMGNWMRW